MPENLRFPNRWLIPLWLGACCLTLPAQIRKVDPTKTITFEVTGATAAYSLASFLAEATAENGLVSVAGKVPGSTHVVVITPGGVQTFEILVTTPPPHYPPGFVMPLSVAEGAQNGSYEIRYYTNPAQIQNQFDFEKANGENRTHVHAVETTLIGPLQAGQPRVALSSASYEIITKNRDITLFDRYVDESPLSIYGSIVRGFHLQQGDWFVHTGYTSVASFAGLFLPYLPELVLGGGYRYALNANSSLTGSFYYLRIPSSDLLGRSGAVGDVRYKYSPRENFWFTLDAGLSHAKFGGAGRLYYKTERDNIVSLVRYMPEQFASLGANSFRGLHTEVAWTRHLTHSFDANVTFYNNNIVLPGLKETTIAGGLNLRYQLTRNWAVTGGALASTFQTKVPPRAPIRNYTLPVGLAFQSKHLGASGQYQFAVTPGRESGGQQYRAALNTGWAAFTFTGYGERDTNAPTLSFIYSQVSGLQQILDQQAIRATTVQQLDELLSSNSALIAAGYIKGASINLVPVRTQLGGSADWASHAKSQRHLTYSFLYNDNQLLQGSTVTVNHTLSYTQKIGRRDDASASCSAVGVREPGIAQQFTPLCFVAWRHQFDRVPYFIIPERHGTISGNVFRDDQSKGALEPGMTPMPEVEIYLDDRRRALTRADGSYRFPNVRWGKHRIVAKYSSRDPFFFTTPSDLEVDEDATVDFGIGYSLSGLTGTVLNDAGQGIPGVKLEIRNLGKKWSAATEADGTFFVSGLVAGNYEVQADENSLPPGYAAGALGDSQPVTVAPTAPGKAAFTVRALRSVSGRVTSYDTKASKYVPVARAQVTLRERRLTVQTDALGRYLFQDLAAGAYTLSVPSGTQPATRAVRLGDRPMDLTNVDFQIERNPSKD